MKKSIAKIVAADKRNGRVTALKLLNKKQLAEKLERCLSFKDEIMKKEGVIPFEERPLKTQKRLNEDFGVERQADDILEKNLNKVFDV